MAIKRGKGVVLSSKDLNGTGAILDTITHRHTIRPEHFKSTSLSGQEALEAHVIVFVSDGNAYVIKDGEHPTRFSTVEEILSQFIERTL